MSKREDPEKESVGLEGENAVEPAPEPSPQPSAESAAGPAAPDAAALAEQLAALKADKEELWKTLIRRQADFENYRKRLERERHEAGRDAVARLIEGLLPVLDAFERALAAHDDPAYEDYRKGFELIYRQLGDALARQGVERIAAEGKRFDPHVHQAIERVETDEHEDGAVIAVLQPGYRLRDTVLRPAAVRVAVHPTEKAAEADKRAN